MNKPLPTLVFALAIGATPLAAQEDTGEVTPLFAADATLEITISGPIKRIARRAESSTDVHPAQLQAAGETHAIELSARGKSRRLRENCQFPPLRVAFPEKPGETSLFHKQGRIKLVTHCRDSSSGEQTLLREYVAYRLYNILTPESLRVRLVRVNYLDDGKRVTQRLGFFIEDVDDAARRLGRKEVDTGNIALGRLDQTDAARYALFQYLIGNTDWSMIFGPSGGDCCHNSRLVGDESASRSGLTPVPYDFDNSGFVDASYAVPNEQLGIRSVTTRLYRGFCAFNDHVPAEAERFRTLRGALENKISATSHVDGRNRSAMTRYLESFFDDIADEETLRKELLNDCR
ncbi:hypothetical protein [Qipengyuania vesicularis]|uniref:hypothetical protein n=1 Tax=Qipengyuania vesicularis TaxID=2867232 RepID=UPI001C88688E|nr:hypothetical protein [Qipengyuania vesicularis]MBX7528481.1 hypothetical protein [Qipengyuania vesicularis]